MEFGCSRRFWVKMAEATAHGSVGISSFATSAVVTRHHGVEDRFRV